MYQDSHPTDQYRNKSHLGKRNDRYRTYKAKSYVHSSHYIKKTAPTSNNENFVIKHRFQDFQIHDQLKQNISTRGYSIPTPIQDRAIPSILNGHDVIGIANTGTGKTAAFLIPLIHKIIQNRLEKLLIIVPTRELAVQIDDEVRAFSRFLHIYSVLCIGGANINRQINQLRKNPHIIISTPGRLKDLITRRFIEMMNFRNVVLDEVDRMVDIGFIQDIKYIISLLPRDRQSLFFSATFSPDVNSIIQSFLKDPVTISVKVQETADGIEQDVIRVKNKNEKVVKLNTMLRQNEFRKVLIFGRTKWGVERLSKTLQANGFLADSIHGNKSQYQRLKVLNLFKQNQLKVLVATDIAARGLDIADVSHVINFDEPANYTDYIHRIGRTARAQKTGKALTFIG